MVIFVYYIMVHIHLMFQNMYQKVISLISVTSLRMFKTKPKSKFLVKLYYRSFKPSFNENFQVV
jgi:hypothetical protein